MDKKLIEKYFSNKCNKEELNLILDWLSNSAQLTDGKKLLYEVWEDLPEKEAGIKTDFETILGKIHHEVNLIESKILIDKGKNDPIRYHRKRYLINFFKNAAAILLLPILGIGIFFSAKYYSYRSMQTSVNLVYNEVFSSVDAITKVTLPDGSNVWLNHSSSLRYPTAFKAKSRDVEIRGEGFFEIAHNPKAPFVVTANDLKIVALGTTFNVMNYPNENKIETSLIDGLVEIRKSDGGNNSEPVCKMKPTDMVIYNKNTKEIIKKNVYDDRYFSWKDGRLIFTAEPMEEVVKRLSRWFNVNIYLTDPELSDLTLTATFCNETLSQVMELLALVSPIKYSISDRKVISNNTFSQREVILSCR